MGEGEIAGERGNYLQNVTAKIKKDLAVGNPVVGTMFIEKEGIDRLDDPLALAKKLGYRFVIIDCEHQLYNPETLAGYAKRAHQVGISIWIRPAQLNETPISRYADRGFSGFLVANAISRIRLSKIIDQAYFHPIVDDRAYIRRGYSIGPLLLDGQRFENFAEEIDYVNRNMIVVVQTEHPRGIVNLEEMLSREGVDGSVIGMNDLSINLARLSKRLEVLEKPKDEMYKDEGLKRAFQDIAAVSEKTGKPAGVHIVRVNQLKLIRLFVDELSYRLMVLGTEANFFDERMLKAKEYIESKNKRL
ncbi:MAG: hypothetical protein HYW70_03010 [Candidatus Nealsonbacteria bacterium]|nr:hypothetical protein [Candidatus Nealsonbacteria bacterium]